MLYIYLYFTFFINFNGYNLFYDHDIHNKINFLKSRYQAPPTYIAALTPSPHLLLRGYKAQKLTLVFVLSIR
jgi:hypothetical protein